MRELNMSEIQCVAGAGGEQSCPADNNYGGVQDPSTLGQDLIDIYEGLVSFTSHVIERVAIAL